MGAAAPNGMNIFPFSPPTQPIPPEFLQDTIVQLLELIAAECAPVSGAAIASAQLTSAVVTNNLTFDGSVAGTTVLQASASATGTLILPVTSATDTLVDLAGTQTLTNKTVGSAAGTALTVVDGGNIAVGSGTGTQIATSAGQKLGFWGVTPVVQQSVTSFAAATTAALTTAAGIYGFTTAAQAAGIISLLNQLRAIVVAEGLAVGP